MLESLSDMHKSYLVLLLLLLMGGQQYSFAQFSGGKLQATGLTCALCNKAIHQSLEELAFVEKVEADIKSSSFNLTFRNDHVFNPSQLKAAVEDAGFFVGELQLTGTWNQDEVERGVSFIWGGHSYQFISSKTPSAAKSFNCIVAGKGYLTDKSFKKLKNEYGAYFKLENNIIQLILVK
jgi:copper chaperone CopZ